MITNRRQDGGVIAAVFALYERMKRYKYDKRSVSVDG